MKARYAVLALALVIGGPVLAEQVHSISMGFVLFTWAVGITATGRARGSRT